MGLGSQLLLGFVLIISASVTYAGDMGLGQGRLFLGSTTTDPKELNTELTTQGIKNVKLNNHFGIEITFPTFQYLQLGLRYTYNLISQDEDPSNSATDYTAGLTQQSMMGIARVTFFKSDYVKADVFAGVGVATTTYKIKTAGQDGTLEKSATPNMAAGASVAFGYSKYFFFMEGGYESNKINDFKSSGNINGNVTAIDLSGSYLLIGFIFDGIPIFSK